MAISDIPEFIEAGPGDLIRAEDWNGVQQQMRESLRTHHHSRPIGTPPTDSGTSDDAEQINTDGIADGAITASKLAPNSVTAAAIPLGGINTDQLADGAVSAAKLANSSVTSSKLSFATVNSGSFTLNAGLTADQLVQLNAKAGALLLPNVFISTSSGGSSAAVTAQFVYTQVTGNIFGGNNVYLRFVNSGTSAATIIWKVLTFAS
jgi:hypothetical protein